MPNLIRTTASIEPRNSGAFLAIENHTYPNEGTYILHKTGIYRSIVPNAVWKGYHTGDWDIYKANSGLTLDDTYVGSIIEFDSKKALDIQGNRFAKPNTIYTKKEQPYLYEYYSITRPELIIDENTFKTPRLSNHLRPTYDPDQIYNEGDILYIEPDTYAEQTFAAGTYKNHLGRSITYQAETKVKRYAVAVRSTKDNNTDNPVTYFGTSWVVERPNDIVEKNKGTFNSSTQENTYFTDGTISTFIDQTRYATTNPFAIKFLVKYTEEPIIDKMNSWNKVTLYWYFGSISASMNMVSGLTTTGFNLVSDDNNNATRYRIFIIGKWY